MFWTVPLPQAKIMFLFFFFRNINNNHSCHNPFLGHSQILFYFFSSSKLHFFSLKKKKQNQNSAVLNGTVPLLPCPCRGREEDFKSFPAQFITLPLALLTQPIPSLMKKQETHAPPPWWKESHALRATPQLTLPCAMTRVRWPSPPLPINTRGGGAERGGETETEGD